MGRAVVHMDLDTFFVSCERLGNSKLDGIPLIIGGGDRGVVASCSYEARVFGVRSAMPMKMALRLCPQAKVIKGDMERYSQLSHAVTDVISEKAPVMEKASIDEFYLDITGMDKFYGSYKWTNELAHSVTKETGLPISFALSVNKTVSKIATGEGKPKGNLEIPENGVRPFLNPLSIRKIPMLGDVTFSLLSRIGIRNIQTLSEMPAEVLQQMIGKNGLEIWKKAKDGKKVRMDSRSGLDYTVKYPPIADALRSLGHDVVLDGEVVVFNEEGQPDFDALQKYNGHNTPIVYCVFDILWLDGNNLKEMPLSSRKELLQMLVKGNKAFRFSESFEDGHKLYQQILDENLEGIVAKKKDSIYREDARGNDWLKVPTRKRQEFVIGGWAESDKSRAFKSLLFGAYNRTGELEWIGRSGGGYKDKEMPGILKKLQALEIKGSPFCNKILDTKGAVMHWIKPELVANFEFATWTKSGRIRKPATFLGFRLDKDAKQVVREIPKEIASKPKER